MEQHQIVEKLMDLYCFQKAEHRFMYINSKDGKASYFDPHSEIKHEDIYDHLDGKRTLSVYAQENTTKFMTFDVDEHAPESVFAIMNKMAETGIPRDRIYVSLSGNKGYHIDVFFSDPVFKSYVENYYEDICRDGDIAAIGFECFPLKHTAIKIPLGINMKTGNRCWYVDPVTLEPLVGDYEYILGIKAMDAKLFDQIAYEENRRAWFEDFAIAKANLEKEKAHGGKVRLSSASVQREPVLKVAGQRHNVMRKRAVYLRRIGYEEDDIYDELLRWVDRQDPNLISSSRRDIELDAAQMAHDVVRKYDPAITVNRERPVNTGVHISPEDINIILKATRKTSRKVAFLILVYCRRFGSCVVGYERMGRTIGVTSKAAYRAANDLVSLGIITKKSCNGLTRINGMPVLRPNEYRFVRKSDGGQCAVDFEKMKDDFDSVYYQTLVFVCGIDRLRDCLTRSEIKKCKEVVASHGAEDTDDDTGREEDVSCIQ